MRHMVIPIFIPHKGCPFDCIFCNQKTISGQTDEMTEEKMRAIIESHLSSVKEDAFIEIGFYGGSFTGVDRELQISFLKTAGEYIHKGYIKEVRLSTRPDYINQEILDYLKYYKVRTIELGVQSLDEEVLSKSCRGHSVNDVITSCHLIRMNGFNLGIQTMIGLPGDNRDKDLYTARRVMELAPGIVRIYPTLVVKGTYLEKMYREGSYTPLSLEDAVDISAQLMELYEGNGINVIRVGLQPTDNINESMDVAAGPFHPAFRQLVESRRMLERVERYIAENSLQDEKTVEIITGKSNVSNIIGQKKANIDLLKKKFGFERVKVTSHEKFKNEIVIKAIN